MRRHLTRLFWALIVLLLGAGAGLLAIAAAGTDREAARNDHRPPPRPQADLPRRGDEMSETGKCEICGKPLDYEPQFCCNGEACGCMGLPIEPVVCGDKCFDAIMDGIGTSFEDRRIKAGIARWVESEAK